MMADVSEINEIKTGINKDGAYAAVFSFAFKCAISLGVLISGYTLDFVGFVEGKGVVQSEQTIINLCAATLIVGPVISLIALVLIKFYPVTANFLEQVRENRLADK
jgi:GPH family glycoside/pentoside/hexuronide:cation symporter